MVMKRFRIPLLLITVALLLSSTLLIVVFATETTTLPVETTGEASVNLPDGFTGEAIQSVNLKVDDGYPWHEMTEVEAEKYGLAGENVYVAGNCGKTLGAATPKSVSNMAITVTEPGSLAFEYALSTRDHINFFLSYSINTPIAEGASSANMAWFATGEVRPGEDGSWATCTVSVDETAFIDDKPAVIYIAYHHNTYWADDNNPDLNYSAIRNVKYVSGERSDVVQGYDTQIGTVTAKKTSDSTNVDITKLEVGTSYSLSAKANDGYQFYGWVKYNGNKSEFQAVESGKLNVTVDATTYYVPVFAAESTYVLRKGTTFYADGENVLKTVIEGAVSGEVIVLLKDATISEDINVPTGVTLYIPFRAQWEKEENGYYDEKGIYHLYYHLSTKDNSICHTAIAGEDETYIRLIVSEGSILSVNGEVVIGSVIGYNSQRFQGHVSGAHGRITNNGRIEVNNEGTLRCYGIVDGSGLTYINDGGTLKETFVIGDFAGGSNSAQLFFTSQMPFKRFSLQSVQCELQMEAKAKLISMINVWANSTYNRAEVAMVGDDPKAAFRPTNPNPDVVAVTRIYHPEQELTDGNGLLDVSGVGRMEWIFSNGLDFQPLTIDFAGFELNTASSDLTIPYNFKIRLVEGTYKIPLGMRLMPGAELIIESGANAEICSGIESVNGNKIYGRLLILDGLVQTDMSTDRYPTRVELVAAGFSGSAEFILNGTLTVRTDATLGGVVKTNGGGKLVIEQGVLLNNSGDLTKLDPSKELVNHRYDDYMAEGAITRTEFGELKIHNWVQQDGALGEYDENTTWFNLPAMIYTANGLLKVEAGKTYLSTTLGTPVDVPYDVTFMYVEDGVYGSIGSGKYGYKTASGKREMTTVTETVVRSMNGVWVDSETVGDTVPVQDPTVVGISGATVTYTTEKSGASTVLNNLQVVDKETGIAKTEKYVFLVKYTVEGNSIGYTIKPDANGNYVIPAEANGVTISAALLGDVNLGGTLGNNDATLILWHTAGKKLITDELALLAADTNGGGTIGNNDATLILWHTAGKKLLF